MTKIETRLKIARRLYAMRSRCYSKNNPAYKYYGGRGIRVCDEWMQDVDAFIDWSLENGYKNDLQIDRIDNDGDYKPSNCRWVSAGVNCKNKSVPFYKKSKSKNPIVLALHGLGITQKELSIKFKCRPQQISSAIHTVEQPTLRNKIVDFIDFYNNKKLVKK